jgi:hypothetical protein
MTIRSHRWLAISVVILSAACLAVGCALGEAWKLALSAGLPLLCGLFALKEKNHTLSTLGLWLSVGIAGVGLLNGADSRLILLGSTLALAAWDLTLFNIGLEDCTLAGVPGRLESKHYQALATAVGGGLLAAWVGSGVRLSIPFVVMVLLAVLAVWSLDRAMRGLRRD